jgi:Na+(H+)/acetate symporter ActP
VSAGGTSSPLYVYSLLIATVLGTMGLPHILVRFYTNRDGAAARRTTVNVLLLLGVFYAFPAVYGFLGRALAPGLYATGHTDSVVLELPALAWPGLGGRILGGLVAAGAFAAFISTSSGLLVSLAGTISHDVWPSLRGTPPGRAARRRSFRTAVPVALLAPTLLALAARSVDISVLVGWAFALAAATFCPLFLLGIWWSGLTARGAALGLAVGGTLTAAAVAIDLAAGGAGGAAGALLSQPALVAVPASFATMVLVSRFAGGRRVDATRHLLTLHAPEDLGLETYRERAPEAAPVTA